MTEQIITVKFEIHEGDVTDPFLWSCPKTGILEVLHINWVDGAWEVTNPEAKPEWNWVGRADNYHLAILDYLQARLGISDA